jgi:PhnB protein
MRWYEQVLGGSLTTLTYGDMPGAPPMSAEDARRLANAQLVLPDGAVLMASDAPQNLPGAPRHEPMRGFRVNLHYGPDVASVQRVYAALAVGGTVHMPLQKTFWSQSFGMLVDRYGTGWMLMSD